MVGSTTGAYQGFDPENVWTTLIRRRERHHGTSKPRDPSPTSKRSFAVRNAVQDGSRLSQKKIFPK